MISPAIERLIRSKIGQFNMMIGQQQPAPGQAPGMNEGGMPSSGIPVTMGGGDNMHQNFKSGEYIFSVPAVIGLGVKSGATSPGDALAIGKHLLDKLQMELKKEVGNETPPKNADPSAVNDQPMIGKADGLADGGMFGGAVNWLDQHVVNPINNLAMRGAQAVGIPTSAPPPAPPMLGIQGVPTRDAADAGVGHNQSVYDVAKQTGYAEGGIVDWAGKNIVDPVKKFAQGLVPHPSVAPHPAPSPSQTGTGYLRNAGEAAQTHNQAVKEAAGYADGGWVNDVNIGKPAYPGAPVMDYTPSNASGIVGDMTPKQPVSPSWGGVNQQDVLASAPRGASGDWGSPAPSAPSAPQKGIDTSMAPGAAPAAASPSPSSPATPPVVDPHGFAQIGKQKVNYGDIGTGQDPLAGKTPVEHAKQFAPQYHGMADETPQKVDPTIWVGTGSTKTTMKESEAYAKGMMNPQQKADYEQRQMAEKELAAKSDLAKATMGIKQHDSETKRIAAEGKGSKTAHQQWQEDQASKKEQIANMGRVDIVNGLLTGKIAPSELSKRSAEYHQIMAEAMKRDPNYNPQMADTTYSLKKNATFRTREMTAEVIPEVLNNVVAAGKKVNYSDVQFAGKVEAWGKGQLNDPDFTNYMVQRNDAIMTIGSVMRGNGMTDKAQELEEQAFHPTLSPKALDAWLQGQMASLRPRLQQYENLNMKPRIIDPQTGKPTDQPVDPSMVVDPATGKVTAQREGRLPDNVNAPQGYTFDSQKGYWVNPKAPKGQQAWRP